MKQITFHEEVAIIEKYMSAFDTTLLLIANGDVEQAITDSKNSG